MKINQLISRLKGIKGVGILAAAFVLGLVLVLALPSSKPEAPQNENSLADYSRLMEEQLTQLISYVEGAGQAHIMVTFEASGEKYYQRDFITRKSGDGDSASFETEQKLVYQDKSPILVKQYCPKIQGVAVVCNGAQNASVQAKIIGIVSCALNLPANRIYVTY